MLVFLSIFFFFFFSFSTEHSVGCSQMSSRFPVDDGSFVSSFIYGFLPLPSQASQRISLAVSLAPNHLICLWKQNFVFLLLHLGLLLVTHDASLDTGIFSEKWVRLKGEAGEIIVILYSNPLSQASQRIQCPVQNFL